MAEPIGNGHDDVVLNKAATIERCVARAREELEKNPDTFGADFTRQDAAIMNIQRACQATLDIGQHLIRSERLGAPQSARDVFDLLSKAGIIRRNWRTLSNAWLAFAISPCMTTRFCRC